MEQVSPASAPRVDATPAPWRRTGATVRRLRIALGMIQYDLGVALGYQSSSANATISKFESGRALPTSLTLARLALLCEARGVAPEAARDLLRAVCDDGLATPPME